MYKFFDVVLLVTLLCIFAIHDLSAQTSFINGRVFNSINNEEIPFANVGIEGIKKSVLTDLNGNYRIDSLLPGLYNVVCAYVGFKKAVFYEVTVTTAHSTLLNIPLEEDAASLREVEIKASPFNKTEESPLSMRTISSAEIYRNPGGNRDISKVLQSFPGVASSVSFRNDIIIRGGAPNENRFYLDGIEVPNINHFATQGSSGGPVGMINVNFIREVNFYSGAFPAKNGNALSSVMEFQQIEGNNEKLRGTFMLGSSDIALTLDGPLGKKSSFVFSARRSYLQFLFQALKLPFLPTYNDFQFKQTIKPDTKNSITIIGLGAIDDFTLNKNASDGVTDTSILERNSYILGVLPTNTQWNYTLGANWKHFFDNSYTSLIVSRNHLNNSAIKYRDNIIQDQNKLLDYTSQELENKVRFEYTARKNGWKINTGVGYENALYTNKTFNKVVVNGAAYIVNFDSRFSMNKLSAFAQASKGFAKEKLTLSLGIRTDFNDYSSHMMSPGKQLSPRFSASFKLAEKINLNFNTGRYYQLPPYTVLGYRDSLKNLVNKQNGIKYISCDHIISGLECNPTQFSKIAVEGFYKMYNNYPFLTRDSVSLANLGADFGVIGNEEAKSISHGRSYGLELLVQQKLSKSVYGILAYTLVRSEFADKHDKLKPSAWDNRHILNLTAGKKFKKNWEAGIKFRLLGGAPYTPYNLQLSALKSVWDVKQQGSLNWNRLNEERFPVAHTLDLRIDKKWFFKKWTLNAYLDIQNVYNFKAKVQPYINVLKDAAGNPVEDPDNPNAYKIYLIENSTGTVLPSVGLMIEF
jgi:CarboxypepD_reg-like domain/TonB-dependent Receptor Plug Domain